MKWHLVGEQGLDAANAALKLDPEPHCNFPAPHPLLTDWARRRQLLAATVHLPNYHHVNSMPTLNQTMEYQTSCGVT